MERKDVERLVKFETKLDIWQETLSKVLETVLDLKDSLIDYVRHDDDSYFQRNMTKHKDEMLNRKIGWLTVVDILWKLSCPILTCTALYYALTH